MSDYEHYKIEAYVVPGLDVSLTTKARGDALEDLICYLLCELPGIKVLRNARDPFQSQEIDLTVANARASTWMNLFPPAILVECKNWQDPVGVTAVTDFIFKLMAKSVEVGIMVAANGLTGDPQELTASYQRISLSQSKGHRVLVLTLGDLRALKNTDEFEELLADRFMEAVGRGRL